MLCKRHPGGQRAGEEKKRSEKRCASVALAGRRGEKKSEGASWRAG